MPSVKKEVMSSDQAKKFSGMDVTKENVPKMIESLQKQLEKLRGPESSEVSLDIAYSGTSIKDVTKVSELLEISASIHKRAEAYNEEVERYQLDKKLVAPFSHEDKSASHWKKVIERAINELINKKQVATLEGAIKNLSKFLDENTKIQKEIEDIMARAGSLIE